MQVFQHVRALITETDCAVVPGFGAFLASHSPAELVRQENKILPPGKKLAFNRQLQTSDGALALMLSRQENIPYQEAVRMLEAWGKHCDQLLLSQGSLEFPELGTVYYDQTQESFRFEKSYSQQFLPSSFLLPELEIYPVEKPASGLRSFDHQRELKPVCRRKNKFRSRILRQKKALLASSFVLLLALFSILGIRQWNIQEAGFTALLDSLNPPAISNQENTQKSPSAGSHLIKTEEAATAEEVSEPAASVSPETVNPKVEESVLETAIAASAATSTSSGYFVVVGAFAVQENAANMSRKLQNEFPDRSVMSRKNNRNLEVVSVYAGATQSEAEAFLQSRASGFPGAWISKYN